MAIRRTPVDHLRPGVFIRLDLKWHQHPFCFSSFKIKHMDQVRTLKELGLSEVVFIPEKSDCLPEPPEPERRGGIDPSTSPRSSRRKEIESDAHEDADADVDSATSHKRSWEKKREQIEQLKKRHRKLKQCENQYHETLGRVRKLMNNLSTSSEEATAAAENLIQGIVGSFLADRESIVHLMNIKSKDEGVFYHSLNVVVLSLVLAKEYGLGSREAVFLGLGALFHDIGKQRIPKGLMYKQTPLTVSEQKLLRMHPVYGYDMMSKISWFDPEALRIIRQHHEKSDGSGYPDGLTRAEISLLTKIASIANTYDNLCNMVDCEQSLTPYEALAYMFRNKAAELDGELLSLFIKCLGVYPPGTVVRLSNDEIGMVITSKSERSLRPSVLIYDPAVPKREAIIFDLEEDPDIEITKSLRPSQLSREVYEYLDPRIRVNYFLESVGRAHPEPV